MNSIKSSEGGSGDEARAALRTYGRAKGRPLSARQQGLIDALLPHLELPLGFSGVEQEALDPRTLFDPPPKEVWLEVGFGGGEHLLGQAERHPEIGFVAAEPFEEGIAKALVGIEEKNLTNIRLHMGDARDIVGRLTDCSIERAFILFADPWPSTRHHKRRLIQPDFIAELARVIRPGGVVRLATDWADYAVWMLERMLRDRRFAWAARRAVDWKTPPTDHVATRYQTKGLGDMAPVFFDFERVN